MEINYFEPTRLVGGKRVSGEEKLLWIYSASYVKSFISVVRTIKAAERKAVKALKPLTPHDLRRLRPPPPI